MSQREGGRNSVRKSSVRKNRKQI